MREITKTKAINMDLVNNVNPKQVADMTFGLLNYLQNRRDARDHRATSAQVVAIAAMFKLVCDVFEVSPQDVMTVAGNVMEYAPGHQIPEFRAAAMYIEKEMKA